MMRRFLASFSTLALLVGFVAAPHTHLHPSGQSVANDSRHAHAVLHSHVTSHEEGHGHDAPADADPDDGRDGLSVDSFVFQAGTSRLPVDVAAMLPHSVAPPALTSIWTGVSRRLPPVYRSPPILRAASRGPPILLA